MKNFLKSRMKGKWIEEIMLLIATVALSALMTFFLLQYQENLKISLKSYEWLAYGLVFFVSLLSSATIFVPAPGVAFMLGAAAIWNPALVALAAGTGDALGEITAYWVGYVGEKIIVDEHIPAYRTAVSWMNKYGMLAIFGIALFPVILFDLVGMAAGALKIPPWKFLLACWAGKVPRAFFLAFLGHQLPFFIHPFS